MAIIGKSDKDIQAQIKILATNLEILNQKLNQNPDAGISPGEKAIKDSLQDVEKELEYVKNVLKSTQTDVGNAFKSEKEGITAQVQKMAKVTSGLAKFDKPWLGGLIEEIEILNSNIENLDETLKNYHKDMNSVLDSQRAEITREIYKRLFVSLKKDNLVMMGFTSLLSSAVALVVLMGLLFFIK